MRTPNIADKVVVITGASSGIGESTARLLAGSGAPTWIGAVPVLTQTPIGARMVAVTASRIAEVPADEFRRLAMAHPAVHQQAILPARRR